MILVSVDLPAPLGPSSAITAPLGTVRSTPRSTSIRPYAACTSTTSRIGTLMPRDRRDRRVARPREVGRVSSGSALGRAVVGVAEVGLLHAGVVADLGRGAGGDHRAEVEDVDLVADRHHQVHVVLDHEDAAALGGQLAQQLAERLGLGLVLARRRLVEQQQLAGRRPGSGPARAAGRCRSGSSRPARRRTPRCRPARAARRRRPRRGPDQPERARRGCRGRPGRCRGRSASRTPRAAGRCGPCRAWRGGAPACG